MRPSGLPIGCLVRYAMRRVAFLQPFTIGNAPQVHPGGAHSPETKAQSMGAGGHMATVHGRTAPAISPASRPCCLDARGSDLAEVLEHGAGPGGRRGPSISPDGGAAEIERAHP